MKKLFLISLLIGNVAFAEMVCEKEVQKLTRCETKFQNHTEVCYVYFGYGKSNVSCFPLQNQSAVN